MRYLFSRLRMRDSDGRTREIMPSELIETEPKSMLRGNIPTMTVQKITEPDIPPGFSTLYVFIHPFPLLREAMDTDES